MGLLEPRVRIDRELSRLHSVWITWKRRRPAQARERSRPSPPAFFAAIGGQPI